MKKKMKITLISIFSLITLSIVIFILVLWLYPKNGQGARIIVNSDKINHGVTTEERNFKYKSSSWDVEFTYSNVYGYFNNFVFKDEGYIIIDKGGYFGMFFQYNENVTVYELTLENGNFIEAETIGHKKINGLAEYDVFGIRYVKIVFDSQIDTEEFCAGNICFLK